MILCSKLTRVWYAGEVRRGALSTFLTTAIVAATSAAGQSYVTFGTNRATASPAYGLSDDGGTAVGWSASGNFNEPGYMWTEATGQVDFTGVNDDNSRAYGISGDGQWAVGVGYRRAQRFNEAFRYRPGANEFQFLGRVSGWGNSTSLDASFDGSVVVGWSHENTQTFGRAFRWTEAGGMQGLTLPDGSLYFSSKANAVSADGSIIVGEATDGEYADALVWSADGRATVLQRLGDPTLTTVSAAYGVSANGRYIVGYSARAIQMTIWEDGVPTGLGLYEGRNTRAYAVSNDGKVVVGEASGFQAIIWTEARGLESLSAYLEYHGINLPLGFELFRASGVSADGQSILALAATPWGTTEGMLFTIPAPAALPIFGVLYFTSRRRR